MRGFPALLRASRLCFLLTALALPCAPARAVDAELGADVPAAKWKALHLRNLPQNVTLTVRVQTSGPIRIVLARGDDAQRFPKGLRPRFSGTAERRLSFRVRLGSAGNYYVILDNRKGDAAREVRIFLEVVRAPPRQKPTPPAPRGPNAI
jgi:hypothetical protein